jgi:hypothetical protein
LIEPIFGATIPQESEEQRHDPDRRRTRFASPDIIPA